MMEAIAGRARARAKRDEEGQEMLVGRVIA
jgi:hypothetical protein